LTEIRRAPVLALFLGATGSGSAHGGAGDVSSRAVERLPAASCAVGDEIEQIASDTVRVVVGDGIGGLVANLVGHAALM
jgi:hypothetical protein